MTDITLDDVDMLTADSRLSHVEFRVVMSILGQQRANAPVYRADMAAVIGCSVSTIGRAVRALKNKGILAVTRLGTKLWSYALRIGDKVWSGQIAECRPRSISASKNDSAQESSFSSSSSSSLLPSDLNDLNSLTLACAHSCSNSDSGDGPLKYAGHTPLVAALNEVVDRPVKPPKERSPFPIRKAERNERLREKMAGKELDQYNCTDLRFVFEDEWTARGWKGGIPPWRAKDLGLARQLIEDFGATDTVCYMQYIFRNWDGLKRRYKLTGYPTMGLMSSYACNIYPEMMNGVVAPNVREYTDRSMLKNMVKPSMDGGKASLVGEASPGSSGSLSPAIANVGGTQGHSGPVKANGRHEEEGDIDYCAKFTDEEWKRLQATAGFIPDEEEMALAYRLKKIALKVSPYVALPDVCTDTASRTDVVAGYRDKFTGLEWALLQKRSKSDIPNFETCDELLERRKYRTEKEYAQYLKQSVCLEGVVYEGL